MPADGSGRLPEGAPTSDERAELLELPNVHATGFGVRERGGELQRGEHVVRVYVHDKVDPADLDDDEKVPEEFMGYPTDVIEEPPPDEQWRGGRRYSGWDIDFAAGSRIRCYSPTEDAHSDASCTPAFIDRNSGRRVMVSNSHVAHVGDQTGSDPIDDSELEFHNGGSEDYKYIGICKDVDDDDSIDASYFEIDEIDGVDGCNRPYGAPRMHKPSDGWPDPVLDKRYINFGAKTGLTQALCTDVDYDSSSNDANAIQFEDYSNPGDSGSLTAQIDDHGRVIPVGLHYAGGEGTSYAFAFDDVETEMGWLLEPDEDRGSPNYRGSGQSGHIEQVVYNTFDTGEGTVKLRALISNTGGESRSTTVGIRNDDDDEWLDSTSVDLDPGEYTYHTYEIDDSWLNSTVLNEDDYEDYYLWQDSNGLEDYHREISVEDEDEVENPEIADRSGLHIGGFTLGEETLGGDGATAVGGERPAAGARTIESGATVTVDVDPPSGHDVIEDFERSNPLDDYDGDTGDFSITSTDVFSESNALINDSGDFAGIATTSLLESDLERGDEITYRLKNASDSNFATFFFFTQDETATAEGYSCGISSEQAFKLWRNDSGGSSTTLDEADISGEEISGWYKVEITTYGFNDDIDATLYDDDNQEIASVSATDGTYDSGQIGWRSAGNGEVFDFATAGETAEQDISVGAERVATAGVPIESGYGRGFNVAGSPTAAGAASGTPSVSFTQTATASGAGAISSTLSVVAQDEESVGAGVVSTGASTVEAGTATTKDVSGSVTASGATAGTLVVSTPGEANLAAGVSAYGVASATATLDEYVPDSEKWLLDGESIEDVTAVARDWQTLEVTALVNADTVENVIRPAVEDAGKLEVVELSNGGFTTVDTSNGGNDVEILAPDDERDLRYVKDYFVDEYDEEALDQAGEEYEVTITAVAAENKETQSSYTTPSRGTDEWLFDFYEGGVATRRVRANLDQRGSDGLREHTLSLLVDSDEAAIIEENASHLAAVVSRDTPGARNAAVDTTSEETNTVTVTPPDSASGFSSGDYVVMGWETERLTDDSNLVELTISPTE